MTQEMPSAETLLGMAVRTPVLVPPAQLSALALQMLHDAEANRRSKAPLFETGPVPGHPVEGDWGAAGMIIQRAMHHLEEALPNGQVARAQPALGALMIGIDLLVRNLSLRGVAPSMMYLGQLPAPGGAAAPDPVES